VRFSLVDIRVSAPEYQKNGFGWEAMHVTEKADLPAAIQKMIDSPGSFLLDITVPYQEHVLPMITVLNVMVKTKSYWKEQNPTKENP